MNTDCITLWRTQFNVLYINKLDVELDCNKISNCPWERYRSHNGMEGLIGPQRKFLGSFLVQWFDNVTVLPPTCWESHQLRFEKKSEKKKNSSNFLRKVFIIEAEIAIVGKIKQYYWQGENDTGITEYVIRVDFMVRSVWYVLMWFTKIKATLCVWMWKKRHSS